MLNRQYSLEELTAPTKLSGERTQEIMHQIDIEKNSAISLHPEARQFYNTHLDYMRVCYKQMLIHWESARPFHARYNPTPIRT